MDSKEIKRKHESSASASELEISRNVESSDLENTPLSKLSHKQQRKQRKLAEKKEKVEKNANRHKKSDRKSSNIEEKDDDDVLDEGIETRLKTELSEIKEILKHVITKEDDTLKDMIRSTIKEMKDELMKSLVKRIDMLEGELFQRDIQNQELKKEITSLKEVNKAQSNENRELKEKIEHNRKQVRMDLNDIEQYQRRNNLKISGLPDEPKETSMQTAKDVCKFLNRQIEDLDLGTEDIDIAHRLGKFEAGKKRKIIVRFTSRLTKETITRNKKKLAGTNVYINEDLTKLNQEVLDSARLKRKSDVENAWCRSGKLFVKWRSRAINQITHDRYDYWLNLPWPDKK